MTITRNKSELVLKFEYNPALIQIVRNLKNRRFDNKKKEWRVDISQVKETLEGIPGEFV